MKKNLETTKLLNHGIYSWSSCILAVELVPTLLLYPETI